MADRLEQPTDIQRVPGRPDHAVILQKKGKVLWHDEAKHVVTPWFDLQVLVRSEQGLLGLAFHPVAQNGRFFLTAPVLLVNDTPMLSGLARAVELCRVLPGKTHNSRSGQFWANHNAGQLPIWSRWHALHWIR